MQGARCAYPILAFAIATTVGDWASAERIRVEPTVTGAFPATTVSLLFLLDENTTPLFGYSLDVEIVPAPGAVGTVTANIGLTNFYDAQNLITAGGATRDPLFSDISGTANGVFITTNTDDLSTVLAADGVNDVLAQVYLDASPDALGDFTMQLGSASALSDGDGFPVSYSFEPGIIRVVPEPLSFFTLGFGAISMLVRPRHRQV